jgi:hypothetical protein
MVAASGTVQGVELLVFKRFASGRRARASCSAPVGICHGATYANRICAFTIVGQTVWPFDRSEILVHQADRHAAASASSRLAKTPLSIGLSSGSPYDCAAFLADAPRGVARLDVLLETHRTRVDPASGFEAAANQVAAGGYRQRLSLHRSIGLPDAEIRQDRNRSPAAHKHAYLDPGRWFFHTDFLL